MTIFIAKIIHIEADLMNLLRNVTGHCSF